MQTSNYRFVHREVDQVPSKYILKRWSNNVKRSHTKVPITYDNWAAKPEALHLDKLGNAIYEVAEMVTDSEDWSDNLMEGLRNLKIE